MLRERVVRALTMAVAAAVAMLCIVGATAGPLPAQVQTLHYATYWPVQGPPLGLALDHQGNLLVTSDTNQGTAAKLYTPTGALLRSYVHDHGYEAYGVAADPNGDVLVADYYGKRVQRFASDGLFIEQWSTGLGQNDGYATFMALDDDRNVYVSDFYGQATLGVNGAVHKFSPGGVPLVTWASPSAEGIAYRAGVVYVCAQRSATVSEYSTSGAPLGMFFNGFPFPGQIDTRQLSIDRDGRMYITSAYPDSPLRILGPDGALEETVDVAPDGYPLGAASYGAAVRAADGSLFAADWVHNAILVFAAPPTPTKSTSWGQLKARYR